jgi:hypothetical protein
MLKLRNALYQKAYKKIREQQGEIEERRVRRLVEECSTTGRHKFPLMWRYSRLCAMLRMHGPNAHAFSPHWDLKHSTDEKPVIVWASTLICSNCSGMLSTARLFHLDEVERRWDWVPEIQKHEAAAEVIPATRKMIDDLGFNPFDTTLWPDPLTPEKLTELRELTQLREEFKAGPFAGLSKALQRLMEKHDAEGKPITGEQMAKETAPVMAAAFAETDKPASITDDIGAAWAKKRDEGIEDAIRKPVQETFEPEVTILDAQPRPAMAANEETEIIQLEE